MIVNILESLKISEVEDIKSENEDSDEIGRKKFPFSQVAVSNCQRKVRKE